MKKMLKERAGNASIYGIVMVFVILLLLTVMMEYMRLKIITGGIRDALQESMFTVSTNNHIHLYNGIREGYSGGYELQNGTWRVNLTEGDVLGELTELLHTTKSGSVLTKQTGSKTEYKISGLAIEILHAAIAPSGSDVSFQASAMIDVEIPFSFGWQMLPPFRVTLRVVGGYTQLF